MLSSMIFSSNCVENVQNNSNKSHMNIVYHDYGKVKNCQVSCWYTVISVHIFMLEPQCLDI